MYFYLYICYCIAVILGNAYLTKFFACGQNPAVLKQSLSAYQQAVSETYKNSFEVAFLVCI